MALIKIDDHLIKVNGKLMCTSSASETPTEEVPGLYDEEGNLVKTWDELIAEGLVTVQ